jgi:hypothetical protein
MLRLYQGSLLGSNTEMEKEATLAMDERSSLQARYY